MVVNYGTPIKFENQFDQKVYTYRVGRTGRFGKRGVAVTLDYGCDSDIKRLLMRNYEIEVTEFRNLTSISFLIYFLEIITKNKNNNFSWFIHI